MALRIYFSFIFSICIFLSLFSQLALSSDKKVVFAQIVHRHGARTPITDVNSSFICPKPLGCGALTDNGKDMLIELGKLIRKRYAGSNWFPQASYDYNKVYSRSTNSPRTLQSSDAFIRGLFSNLSSTLPVVSTVSSFWDILLRIESNPSFIFQSQYNSHQILKSLKPLIKKYFNKSTIAKMAEEADLQKYCLDKKEKCILRIQDIGTSWFSDGLLKPDSTIKVNLDKLDIIRKAYFTKKYSYDKNSVSDRLRGSPGQPLAQKMISEMYNYVSGNQSYAFFEYSGHDTTLLPFCATLGAEKETLPLYGQFYLIELLRDSKNRYFVQAWKGYPQQAPGNHKYPEPLPLVIHGIYANGTEYDSDNETDVTLEDFARFIDSSKPQSDMGLCFISDTIRRWIKCDIPAAPEPGSYCAEYRSMCMQYACPKGMFLKNPSTLECAILDTRVFSLFSIFGIVSCTLFGGMIFGFCISFIIYSTLFRKKLELPEECRKK